ncbi:hypothetical protein Aperf_G00000025120 [Anoplocephala perfoliata]
MGQIVWWKVNQLVMACKYINCFFAFTSAISNAFCYFGRRFRELRPTSAFSPNDYDPTVEDHMRSLLKDGFYARVPVAHAAEFNSSQYFAPVNAIFTAQKVGALIDASSHSNVLLCRESFSTSSSSTTLQESGHPGLFQQATELTSDRNLTQNSNIYALLQYPFCVFLHSAFAII